MSENDPEIKSDDFQHSSEQLPSQNDGAGMNNEFLKSLSSSLRNFSLYPAEHPVCSSSLLALLSSVDFILEKRGQLILGIIGTELVIDGKPILEKSPVNEHLAELLSRKKIEKIVISKGLTMEELKEFVSILYGDFEPGHARFNEILESHGVINIRSGTLDTTRRAAPSRTIARGLQEAERDYRTGMDISGEINDSVRAGREIKLGEVSSLAKMLVRGVMENQTSLMTILNLHTKDEYLVTHSIDVALLTLIQVERFNLDENLLGDIAAAAVLHDLGKLNIPDEILKKAGPLSEEQWEVMKKHPVWGAEKSQSIKGVTELAVIISFEHHIRYNQSGYPERRLERPLASLSHMVAIADAYDAMRSKRPYQDEMTPEDAAAALMKSSGTALHPVMTQRFLDRVGIFGVGTFVRLSTGDIGLVMENVPGDPFHPVVKVLGDSDGRPVGEKVINLSSGPGREAGITIERSLPPDEKYEEILCLGGSALEN